MSSTDAPRRRRPVTAAILFVLGVLGIVGLLAAPWLAPGLWVSVPTGPHPSDEAAMVHWRTHRPAFERLVGMLHEDEGLKRLGKDFTDPDTPEEAGITAERLALYRALSVQAGIPSFHRYGRAVSFLFHASGLPISGSAKSFVYDESRPHGDEVTDELEAAAKQLGSTLVYRKIDTNWWLLMD